MSSRSMWPAYTVANLVIIGCPRRRRSFRRLDQLGNDPEWFAPGGDPLDVVEAVAEARGPVLPRRSRRMGRQCHVGQREERVVLGRRLLDEHGEPGPAHPPLQQRWVQLR